MLVYIVKEDDIHTPITCKEVDYAAAPRVGEKIVANSKVYTVSGVYHNLDVQEIKIVVKNE